VVLQVLLGCDLPGLDPFLRSLAEVWSSCGKVLLVVPPEEFLQLRCSVQSSAMW
jgi:hypothetical protein